MTPTPEELVKWLRKNAKMIGPWIGPVGDADRYKREGVKYSAAADLIEQLTKERDEARHRFGAAIREQMKTFAEKPNFMTFVGLKHGVVGDILRALQDGCISRGKACESLAEVAHGAEPSFAHSEHVPIAEDLIPVVEISRLTTERTAQAEALRQMREALGAICEGSTSDISELVGSSEAENLCIYCGQINDCDEDCPHEIATTALTLPVTEAEKQARENAEKAGLLDWLESSGASYSLEEFGWEVSIGDTVHGPNPTLLGALRAAKEASDGSSMIRLEADQTKSGKARVVPIYPEIREALQNQPRGAYVFTRQGKPIRDIREGWRAACAAAGVHGLLFHDLRRSAVRNMERLGFPRGVAMSITGHSTESVYCRYNIVSEQDITDAIARFEHQNKK